VKAEDPTPTELATLQALLDRSTATASPAVADSVGFAERQMTAAELVEFWRGTGLVAMTTVGPEGQPHTAPVHARLEGATLRLVIYDNTVRRRDLQTNPRLAFTTWRDGAAVIMYGRGREVPDSLREARTARSGAPRHVVEIEVTLTRVYAMLPPEPSA
jgi:hypothetical protein